MRRTAVGIGGWMVWAAACAWASVAGAAEPSVRLDSGVVQGLADGDVAVFRGIPYAQPPLGALRWQPPQPVEAWTAPRAARAFGPACPQPPRGKGGQRGDGLGGEPERQSEDCLSLNVWSPSLAGKAPVMVWIHGGAHRYGAASQPFYDGAALARQGVVLVSLNYRLGLFGYFAHPALTAEAGAERAFGNYGLLDQLAALRWVQRNIAQFGGDPARVTVFGESAGGASILYLLTTPAANGLFAQAIVESGGGWQRSLALADKEAEGVRAANAAGLDGAKASAAALRALPVEALNRAISVAPVLSFGPFVDGRTVTASPAQRFAAGHALDVPLIIGSNSYEASLLDTVGVPPATLLQRLSAADLKALRAVYPELAGDDDALARAYFADASFAAPARWIAAHAHDGAPSWLYRFSYTLRPGAPGASHGAEIPYVFKTLGALPALRLFLRDRDRAMSDTISACWVAFARSGVPACAGAPAWPAYQPKTDTLLEFGAPSALRERFRAAALDFQQQRFEQETGGAR